ncbi:MAG: MFS transporter [Chloroflexi bacterium]|nr:MFS transporter [Chloroflexota bacterium]
MLRTLIAAVCTFLNVPALMTVAPVVAQSTSGRAGDGGLITAVFSGATVLAELSMPSLMGRIRPGRLFAIALALIGGGSLAHLLSGTSSPWMMLLAAVRGLGFGTAVVTGAVLVTELAPSGARGRAIGNLGLAIGGASMVSPSLGLLLLSSFGPNVVFALTGTIALVGIFAVDSVDRGLPRPVTRPIQVTEGLREPGLAIPVAALALLTVTYGGLVSYGALVLDPVGWGSAASFFFLYGAGRAVSRWLAGRGADRLGARRVILPGMGLALVGLLLLTLTAAREPLLVALAGLLYGGGAGMAQSAAFVGMLGRAKQTQVPLVSTLWNLAYDGGVSIGGAALGVLAATSGETAVLWSLTPVAAVAFLLFLLF